MSADDRAAVPAAKPTVVLACSAADAGALSKVLKRLVEAGLRVDVCPGVEVDMRALQRSLARADARTIFTLCRGRNLDGVQLEHLYRLVRQSGIPSERAHVLRFESHRADELASTLLARLGEHGLVTDVAAPEPVSSSQDVTSPVLLIPRELIERGIASDPTTPIAIDFPLHETAPTKVASERSHTEMRVSAVLRAKPDPRSRTRVLPAMVVASLAMIAIVVLGLRTAVGGGESAKVVAAGLAPAPLALPLAVAAPMPLRPAHVDAAIAHGTIRALQGLLVATDNDTAMHGVVARRHCKELYLAGLSEWRVPTRAELETLAVAGFLPADTTWWHDGEARAKPRARWDGTRLHDVAPAPRAAARAVCVHAP